MHLICHEAIQLAHTLSLSVSLSLSYYEYNDSIMTVMMIILRCEGNVYTPLCSHSWCVRGQFEMNDIGSALIYDWGTAGWGHILFCTRGQDWQGYQIVIVNIDLIS